MTRFATLRLLAPLALAAGLAACSDGATANGDGQVAMRIATRAAGPAAGSAAGSPSASAATLSASTLDGSLTVDLGGHSLVIDGVQLVARRIELEGDATTAAACVEHERADSLEDADSTEAGDDHGGHGAEPGDDHVSTALHDDGDDDGADHECGEIEAGPVLVDLPLTAGAQQAFSASVPAGSYREIKFQIHRPTGDSADVAFLQAHPDFANTSIRVTGTFDGAPFTFTSGMTVAQKTELAAPLVVAEGGTADLTLFVDVSRWFLTADGAALVDPAQAGAGSALQAVVETNIQTSFHGFHDHDHDGERD